ncbi:hypothetical protein [uncultured Sphingomonas sp.]|uniref:hypothetical protein n=1 Tax=uncultured Sphingomonas sp. TaxID=158754 RepID=UPI0025FD1104|nr:hypothetical protein [uncultured Sphingomonas sp.]
MMHLSMLLIAIAPQVATVLPPQQAIARVDASRAKAVNGTFVMKVAVVVRTSDAFYLNSSMDIRSSGNLVFHLTPDAIRQLKEKLGPRADMALVGRTVQVKGTLKRVPIVTTRKGDAASSDEVQYEVRVASLSNLKVI